MDKKPPSAEEAYLALIGQVSEAVKDRQVLFVGIHTGGAWLARRMATDLAAQAAVAGDRGHTLGFLSSAFHRDDYGSRGLPGNTPATELPLSIDGADIVLIDDILFTGRTVRASLNELFDYGRPSSVELAVLLDRGGRQLPISAKYCGTTFELAGDGKISLAQDKSDHFSFSIR